MKVWKGNDEVNLVARHEGHEVESESVWPDDGVVLAPPPVDHLGDVEAQYEAQWYEVY